MIQRFLTKIFSYYEDFSVISVKDRNLISSDASIKGAKIYGDVRIGEGARISRGVKIQGNVNIGRFTSVNGPNTDLTARINSIEIGNFCSIARNVSFQEFNHAFDRLTSYYIFQNVFKESVTNDIVSKGSIRLGDDVWVGTHCVILSGANIGSGAIIAANSVVSGEIPPYAIAAGSPAKVIRYRFSPEVIEALQQIKWWEWPLARIRDNKDLFSSTFTMESIKHIK